MVLLLTPHVNILVFGKKYFKPLGVKKGIAKFSSVLYNGDILYKPFE